MTTTETIYTRHDSPIGPLLLVGRADGLAGIYMAEHQHGPGISASWRAERAPFADALRQLDEYFAGTRTRFELALAPSGTPFQLRVWDALRRIAFGETWSYARLAIEIGNPNASRAVGAANGRNPLSIVVPCHRVVGADGSLTGYAGGVARKRWLLAHEGARGGYQSELAPPPPELPPSELLE